MTAVPDLTTYRLIHRLLREGARRMAVGASELDLADRHQLRAFAKYWQGYAGELLHHHTVEDRIMFPSLEVRAPQGVAVLAGIDGDHHHMDVLMEQIGLEVQRVTRGRGTSRLEALLWELTDLLDEHLDVEDAELLPLFERLYTAAEYEQLEGRIPKEVGMKGQALFTVPFVMDGATDEEKAAMVEQAPAALRLVYRMTRNGYERMCASAFPRTPRDGRPAVAASLVATPVAGPQGVELATEREMAVA